MVVGELKQSVSFLDFRSASFQIEPAKIHHHQSDVWKTEPKPSQTHLPGHTFQILHGRLIFSVRFLCLMYMFDIYVNYHNNNNNNNTLER